MCWFRKKKEKEVKKTKKTESKKVSKKETKVLEEPKEVRNNARVYHVSKREEDGKWIVKFASGQKVIKTFDTQKEAVEYTKKMAENQDGAMLVHNSKGKNKGKIKSK